MIRLQPVFLSVLVLALPFNGLIPLLEIGELSRDGFFYGSLLYILATLPVSLRSSRKFPSVLHAMLGIQAFYLIVIVFSFFVNLDQISENIYGAKSGYERFFSGFAVYIYYFYFSCILLSHALLFGIERFCMRMSGSFLILAVFLSVVCMVELSSWFFAPIRELIVAVRSVFAVTPERVAFRLSGVSLEPSFNAFALLACIPWVLFRAAIHRRRRYVLLATLLILLSILSGARTAYVGLAAMAVAYVLARGSLKKMLPAGLDGGAFVLGMFAFGLVLPLIGFAGIDADSTTSNVTRSYFATAAIDAGLDRFFGQGFGQATFHVVRQTSPLIQYSWELLDFYQGSRFGVLPPLYSWYARSFGEFGIVGYALIAFGFARVATRVFSLGHGSGDFFERRLFFLCALMIAQFLAIALSIESVRMPQFWLAWMFSALLLMAGRQRKAVRARTMPANVRHA